MVCFLCGEGPKILYLQRTMEIGDQRGRGAASLEPRVDWGRNQKIFLSPENYGDWRSARSRSSVLSVWKSTSVPGAIEGISRQRAGVGAGVGIDLYYFLPPEKYHRRLTFNR